LALSIPNRVGEKIEVIEPSNPYGILLQVNVPELFSNKTVVTSLDIK